TLMKRRFLAAIPIDHSAKLGVRLSDILKDCLQIREGDLISRAERPFVSYQVVKRYRKIFFFVLEQLRRRGRDDGKGRYGDIEETVEDTNAPVHLGFQEGTLNADISSSGKFIFDQETGVFIGRSCDGTDKRFGNDASKHLIESGDLVGLQPHAFIETHAAQSARVGRAQKKISSRIPNQARLWRDMITITFRIQNRRVSVIGWIL